MPLDASSKYRPFTDSMVSKWHWAPATIVGDLDAVMDWCEQSCHGRWSMGWARHGQDLRRTFFFKGPNDLLAFRLTWCES